MLQLVVPHRILRGFLAISLLGVNLYLTLLSQSLIPVHKEDDRQCGGLGSGQLPVGGTPRESVHVRCSR